MRHWDFMNLICTFHKSLDEFITDIESGDREEGLAKVKRMRDALAKIKSHCIECDQEQIINRI